MGAKRKIVEEVTLPGNPSIEHRERETTDLQWVNEFVAKKVQSYILAGLKTAKVHLLLFGSSRTNNTLLERTDINEGYDGIDEVFKPDQPTIATLELLRCLRASKVEQKPFKADPLDALVAAITTLNNKDVGGTTNTWRRTIYLITDGKSKMNKSDVKLIQDKLIESNITLKVVGIDFDDASIGFKEEDKDALKADNEAWWKEFLASLPSSGMATAAHVIDQSSLPSIQLQASAASATSLTFGDPADRHTDKDVMDIAVKLYKATATARPLSQKKLSKIAQESAAAQSQTARLSQELSQYRPSSTPHIPRKMTAADQLGNGENGLTYGVQMQKKYFIKDDLEMVEGGIDGAEPLPEDAEQKFDKAYKLGATLVAINEDLERPMDTKAGMEIIQFTSKHLYRRQYHMGETWFLFASEGNYKAQLQLSSLIQAMSQQKKYAIVRHVRRDGAEPKLGILAPVVREEIDSVPCECMCYVEAPFREDLKRFTFPPLDRVINRDGKELEEHASLPSKEMQSCMDDMVDSMDLMDAVEDDGTTESWFKCVESFNPAIHAIKEAVSWRVFHPEDKSLPQPHPEVMKYLKAPEKVEERSETLGKRCRELFELGAYFPIDKKLARRQAEERAREKGEAVAGDEKKEINLEGVMDEELAAEEALRQPSNDDSDTEDEEEVVQVAPRSASPSKTNSAAPKQEVDAETSKGKTSSSSIEEFEAKLLDRDLDSGDVIDEMGSTITSKITNSFGSNEYSEAREMIQAMRRISIENEEAERFNTFLHKLKTLVLDESLPRPRADFWNTQMRGREELSLITDRESMGDPIDVDDRQSAEFINL